MKKTADPIPKSAKKRQQQAVDLLNRWFCCCDASVSIKITTNKNRKKTGGRGERGGKCNFNFTPFIRIPSVVELRELLRATN